MRFCLKMVVLIFVIFMLSTLVFADGDGGRLGALAFSPSVFSVFADSVFVSKQALHLNALYGSHRIGTGAELLRLWYVPVAFVEHFFHTTGGEFLGLSGRIGALYYLRDFGFPGEVFVGEGHVKVLYSLGRVNSFFGKYPQFSCIGKHTLSFGYNAYLATNPSSQLTGQLDYAYCGKKDAVIVRYVNDTMLLYLFDRYRTAAFAVNWLHDFGDSYAGLGLGFKLWAGERRFDWVSIWNGGDIRIPDEVRRGATVTLHTGAEYAVDVVYATLFYNSLSLSFGYDSELFKQVIHNSIHYLLNDGNLPLIDRPARFYFEFTLGLQDNLF